MNKDLEDKFRELHPQSYELREVVVELLERMGHKRKVEVLKDLISHLVPSSAEFSMLFSEMVSRISFPGDEIINAISRKFPFSLCVLLLLKKDEEGVKVFLLRENDRWTCPQTEWRTSEKFEHVLKRLVGDKFDKSLVLEGYEPAGFTVGEEKYCTKIYNIFGAKLDKDLPEEKGWWWNVSELPETISDFERESIIPVGIEWFVREW